MSHVDVWCCHTKGVVTLMVTSCDYVHGRQCNPLQLVASALVREQNRQTFVCILCSGTCLVCSRSETGRVVSIYQFSLLPQMCPAHSVHAPSSVGMMLLQRCSRRQVTYVCDVPCLSFCCIAVWGSHHEQHTLP